MITIELPSPTLWCVNIHGSDDVIATTGYLEAVRQANAFNGWWLELRTAKPLREQFDARMWAAPLEWPYDADSHAAAISAPSEEYDWLAARVALACDRIHYAEGVAETNMQRAAEAESALEAQERLIETLREPTPAMIEKGLAATGSWLDIPGSKLTVNREKMRRRYCAMIAEALKGGDPA